MVNICRVSVSKTVVIISPISINEVFKFNHMFVKMSFFMNFTKHCKPQALERKHVRERNKTPLPVARNFQFSAKPTFSGSAQQYAYTARGGFLHDKAPVLQAQLPFFQPYYNMVFRRDLQIQQVSF